MRRSQMLCSRATSGGSHGPISGSARSRTPALPTQAHTATAGIARTGCAHCWRAFPVSSPPHGPPIGLVERPRADEVGLRILHAVELYAPSVGGAQAVVRQISERLAARGHEVTVATTRSADRHDSEIAGVQIEEFDVRGNEVRGMEGEIERYRRFVANGDFDIVMTYAAQQWTTDALLPIVDDLGKPVVLAPCGFSGLHDVAYGPYFAHLRDDLHRFAALVFHSNDYQDIHFARAAGIQDAEVIPNGADEREFFDMPARGSFRARHSVRDDAPLLLTVGAHTGQKGHAQAINVLRHASLARGGALTIVGNTPFGRGCMPSCRVRAGLTRVAAPSRRVIFSDPPRPSVVAAYADADIFLFCS